MYANLFGCTCTGTDITEWVDLFSSWKDSGQVYLANSENYEKWGNLYSRVNDSLFGISRIDKRVNKGSEVDELFAAKTLLWLQLWTWQKPQTLDILLK